MTRVERLILVGTVFYLIIEKPKLVNNIVVAAMRSIQKPRREDNSVTELV